jgi:hypothetical protein
MAVKEQKCDDSSPTMSAMQSIRDVSNPSTVAYTPDLTSVATATSPTLAEEAGSRITHGGTGNWWRR